MKVLFLCVLAGLATSMSGASASASSLPARAISWLAAGDSYSSGEGLPHSTGTCAQPDGVSSKSWEQEAQQQLAQSGKLTTSRFDFTACTGALTGQFFAAKGGNPAEWDGTTRYDLITFTFGGDDIGFAPFLEKCLAWVCPTDASTRDTIRTVGNNYRSFLERVANEASQQGGNILVLGYPELIEDPNQWTGIPQLTDLCQGLGRNQAVEIRGLGGALNQAIGNAVSIVNGEHPNGVTLRFLDVNSGGGLGIGASDPRLFEPSSGTRHNLCGADSWMNGLSSIDKLKGSFHPKQAGLDSEANMVEQVLTSQMNWDATQPLPAAPVPAIPPVAAPPVAAPPVAAPPVAAPVAAPPKSATAEPSAGQPASSTSGPTPPSQASPVNRTGILSYDQMRGGAPYWGRSNMGWQAFTAASNTITEIGVTWSNPADTPGQAVQGASTRISLCAGVDANAADPCVNRLGDTWATVINQAETTGVFSDIAVAPGATYYLFYYQPSFQSESWDMYWWSCPGCPSSGRNAATLSDQNQAVVRGYNR